MMTYTQIYYEFEGQTTSTHANGDAYGIGGVRVSGDGVEPPTRQKEGGSSTHPPYIVSLIRWGS